MPELRISEINAMKSAIRQDFEAVIKQHKPSIFSKWPGILDELLGDVLREVDTYTVVYSTLRQEPHKPPPCEHKWRDCEFWYMEFQADDSMFAYKIFEPYICIYCKKREDKLLQKGVELISPERSADDIIREFYDKFPALRPRAVVEDAVNDIIMVDREHLRMVDILHGNAPIDTKIILK
jgi:hypothetical protein